MSEILETNDVEVAEHMLRDAYGGNIRIDAVGPSAGVRLDIAPLTPSVRLDHINFGMNFGLAADPLGVLVMCHVRSGGLSYRTDGAERAYGPGDVFFPVQPDHSYRAECRATDFDTAVIDPALPSRIADTAPGRSQQPVRFTSYQPVSAPAAQTWGRTYRYVRDTVLAAPDLSAQPLLAASAARLLVAVALAVFPNNAVTDPTAEDRRDAHPATLRRAVAFIDEHAQSDIALADIAAAAHVSIRAVQLAFRRHLGTTPLAYLRQVRLSHAHAELARADSGATTVTTVAYRWGFSNSSRFTVFYRQAYGVTPSETLRQS